MENLGIYYANDNHLSIILSEYLKNKNKERCQIVTFFQKGIENQIKSNILEEINFNENKNPKDFNIINKNIGKEIIIIIRGKKEYINTVYNEILKNNNNIANKKVKIIKCYNIENQENEIKENIKENKKIISTIGETDIF